MDYFNNIYGLLLVIGSVAIILVIVLYFIQKRKSRFNFEKSDQDVSAQIVQTNYEAVKLDTKSLTEHLSPFRNNQPIFIHYVVNLLERVRRTSDIKMIHTVIKQLEGQTKLLNKIKEFEDAVRTLENGPIKSDRDEELARLRYEKEKLRLLNDIKDLAGDPNSKDEEREQELKDLESELIHKSRIQVIRDDIDRKYKDRKRQSKNDELDNMIAGFEKQYQAIKNNHNLPDAAKKESLRTIEKTFITQLDDFERGL